MKIDVKKVAKLANLPLSDSEEEKYSQQLSKILGYMDQLDQANTDYVRPIYNVSGKSNAIRTDVIIDSLTQEEAIKNGALTNIGETYPDKVKVYKVGTKDNYFSKELCGGPHVEHTGVIGKFKILKQESLGSGLKRIYATIEN